MLVAQQRGLDLLLLEVGQDVVERELPLRKTDDPRGVAGGALGTEGGEGQLIHVMVVVHAGDLQRLLQALQLRRHHLVLQLHGGGRVLHGPVIDHDQLLHIVGDGRASIAAQLGSRGRQGRRKAQSSDTAAQNLRKVLHRYFTSFRTDGLSRMWDGSSGRWLPS